VGVQIYFARKQTYKKKFLTHLTSAGPTTGGFISTPPACRTTPIVAERLSTLKHHPKLPGILLSLQHTVFQNKIKQHPLHEKVFHPPRQRHQ
jgi:hypothetical protein